MPLGKHTAVYIIFFTLHLSSPLPFKFQDSSFGNVNIITWLLFHAFPSCPVPLDKSTDRLRECSLNTYLSRKLLHSVWTGLTCWVKSRGSSEKGSPFLRGYPWLIPRDETWRGKTNSYRPGSNWCFVWFDFVCFGFCFSWDTVLLW